MKKQLIIKIPKEAGTEEIKSMIEINHRAYYQGTPMYLFPGWEYEVIEVSEPIMFISEPNKDDYEKFRRAFKKESPMNGNVAQKD